jgi:hypothetical protein
MAHVRDVQYEIIVVDNASDKDDPDEFIKKFPSVVLVKSPHNGGFANGNNQGIQASKGDTILLLNSDTILTEDCISPLAKILEHDKSIGVISPHLVYADGKYQRNARAFRSIRNELLDVFRPLLWVLSYRKRATLMLNQFFKGDFDTQCDWVSGAFFMFLRESLKALPGGKLDERFFMYGEDQLWCYQFREAGLRAWFVSGVRLIHIANASTSPTKQLALLKTMMARELEVMRYRKGRSLYYYFFAAIFSAKEWLRYYIKLTALRVFKYRFR